MFIDAAQFDNLGAIGIDDLYGYSNVTLYDVSDAYAKPEIVLGDGDTLSIRTDSHSDQTGLILDLSDASQSDSSTLQFIGLLLDGKVVGSDGADYLSGSGTGAKVFGKLGNDELGVSGDGARAYGGGGDDTLFFRVGVDGHNDIIIDGGSGNDTLSSTGNGGTLIGGEGDDLFVVESNSRDTRYVGGAGSDELQLLEYADLSGAEFTGLEWTTLHQFGGATPVDAAQIANLGRISLSGDAETQGYSKISLTNVDKDKATFHLDFTDGQYLSLFSGGSTGERVEIDFRQSIFDGNGYLKFQGKDAKDILRSGSGDDELFGFDGNDKVSGAAGNDLINGGSANDSLYGCGGFDNLHGEFGNDMLFGGAGQDVLDGGHQDDTLDGDDGRDLLIGGFGNDLLSGGDGQDVFQFDAELNEGTDTILDWQDGIDLIRIGGGIDFSDVEVSGDESTAIVSWNNTVVTLVGVPSHAIDFTDFEFV